MTMIIPNYETLKILDEQPSMVIYQGKRLADQTPVLIKVLASTYPSLEEITWLKQDYLISKTLNCSGILKPYDLETYQDIFALILEDFGGLSLKYWLKNSQFSLIKSLKIVIKVSEVLEYLQQISLIHKNLKSSNIFFNRETGEVKLTDWTIATQLALEKPTIDHSYFLRSNLSYISPEQTGRMNRMIDSRSDLYSLGVIFYELLTGKLLFDTKDSLSLIHCHIAKQPISPQVVNSEIPQAISDIVMRLLAKDAEDRYQSASGLKFDLETCLFQLQENQVIQNFILGGRDQKTKLLISQKLYGRKQEIQALLNAFYRVQLGNTEIMLVSGYTGVGKTSIINEVHKPILKAQGYFITGKFDQVNQNIPYNAFIQAFQELIRQLLTENEEKNHYWREKIIQSLSPNTQVIIDIIPQLELIIGKQPEVAKLNLSESQNRFNQVFQKFIQLFCQPEHPLVIFLDDLQWSDSASLKLIELLLSDMSSHHLLIVGIYRKNEISPLIKQTIDILKTTNININHLLVKSLSYHHVSQFLSDTLGYQKKQQKITDLAKLIYNKSQGNPLFFNQFLKTIYEKGFLKYQVHENQWTWDISKISEIKITDNSLVELIVENICKLPLETQRILQLAACIGNQFTLKILSIINETSELITAQYLWIAIQAGLIIPCSDKYKIPLILSNNEFEEKIQNKLQVDYKFLHDQVQQAAYLLIPSDEKKITHLKIGRILLQKVSSQEQEETIFEIVNQLNKGIVLITDSQEKHKLSQLNLLAAKKAKTSTAYTLMKEYLKIGIELLPEDSWKTQYEYTLALYEEASEAAYLNGDFTEIQHFVNIVLQNTNHLLDQIKIYEVQIQAYIVNNQLTDAIQTALFILKHLNVDLPTTLEEAQFVISQEQIETLIELPMMTDAYKLAAIKIMATVTSAAYQGMPDLFPLVILKEVNLFLNYGNTIESAFAYGCYGLILIKVTGDIETAYKFGKLALMMADKWDISIAKAKIILVVQAHINHHKLPLKETLDFLKVGYQIGLETGDLEFAGYLYHIYCYSLFFLGQELNSLEKEFRYYGEKLQKIKQYKTFRYHENYRSSILKLLDKDDKEKAQICTFTETDLVGNYGLFLNKMLTSYLFEQYEQAYEYAKLARNYIDSVCGLYIVPIFYFYDSLVQLAVYSKATEVQQQEILNIVVANQKKLYHLANHAPANFLHKYYLVKAEQNRVFGNLIEAMNDYDRAINLAKENEYTSEEAIANELAAKFYFKLDRIRIAQAYMADAYYTYIHWGAIAKAKNLSQHYSQLLNSVSDKDKISKNPSQKVINDNSKIFSDFDLNSVIKVSQTIASEVFLNRLLARLIKILIENAGAQFGFIILEKNDNLYIEAQGDVESDTTVIGQSILVDSYRTLPLSLLKYVQKTRKNIILDNASQSEQFNSDIYIIVNQPKSLLCLPIVNYGRLIGLLYLENNLILGAFTSERLESLKILCTQAAISIENARLYEEMILLNKNLQKEIEERFLVEVALRENQEKLQAILDNSPTVVYLKDEQSRYILINRQYEKLFHLTKEQIKGKTDAEIFSPEVGIILSTNDRQVLAIGKPLEFEENVPHDDGIHTYLSIKFPLYDSEGKRYGICGISTDITERKQAELERLKFTQELAIKNAALEDIQEKLAESNRTLEQKVKERTQELSQTLEVLKDTQAELLIENALLRTEQEQSQYEYQVGGSLPLDSLTYVVRHADRQLYQFLKKSQFCYVFNARQMGKSSLRIQITKRLKAEGIKCAAIDLSVIGSHQITLEQWYTGFAYLLASELDLLSKFNIRTWWQEYQGLSPLHRLREFISQIVLREITENIVIFIDEIDSVINLNFKVDDFFILLRSFYNQRSDSPDFNRLTFALFGVATSSQLILDKIRTPFNIGQVIYLEGFKLHEAQPLLYGLKDKVKNPQLVLNTVLSWTNGQPFLTQKVCRLIHGSTSPTSDEIAWVDNLVQTEIIKNWETKDNPEHLKTIRDRLFNSSLNLSDLLKLYQQIWLQGEIKAVNSPEEVELILSGLIIKQEGMLKVKNRIYYLIFNHDWIERNL